MTSDFNIVTETLTSLGVGSKLSIAFSDLPEPIPCFMTGMKIGQYIIISIPDFLSKIRSKLFKENKVIIRYLYKGQVIAFASELIDYITLPDHLIFIKYPVKLMQKNIRETKRIECLIPATTTLSEMEFHLVITDISLKGCGLKLHIGNDPDKVDIKINQKLIVKSMYLSGKSEIEFSGIVKNYKKNNDKVFIGIQFRELPSDIQDYIQSYNALMENFS